MEEKLIARASIGIQKPAAIIFEAVVNPAEMRQYFIASGSARMETGGEVQWTFPEFEDRFPVQVLELTAPTQIRFRWDPQSEVSIILESLAAADTVVRVTETGYRSDAAGIQWAIRQTEGWANFLACMKAYLEYGIGLRKGAFTFMQGSKG
ncbi:SRPBCC family protein [Niabella terrae]